MNWKTRIFVACFGAAIVAGSASAQLSAQYRDWANGPAKWIMTADETAKWKQVRNDSDAKAFVDLFWARLVPYQLQLKPGESADINLELRNSFGTDAVFTSSIDCAVPLQIEPEQQELKLKTGEKKALRYRITVPTDASANVKRR